MGTGEGKRRRNDSQKEQNFDGKYHQENYHKPWSVRQILKGNNITPRGKRGLQETGKRPRRNLREK